MGFFDRIKDLPIDDESEEENASASDTTPAPEGQADNGVAPEPSNRISFDQPEAEPAPEQPAPRRHSRFRRFMAWFLMIVVVVLAAAFYIRYFNPYVTDAHERGYVTSVDKRGIIFKTYEVEMVSESAIADTSRLYSRNVNFSVASDSLALELRNYQGTGERVEVVYKTYYATLPWRGNSRNVITAVNP